MQVLFFFFLRYLALAGKLYIHIPWKVWSWLKERLRCHHSLLLNFVGYLLYIKVNLSFKRKQKMRIYKVLYVFYCYILHL
jgi:hypothetical protein